MLSWEGGLIARAAFIPGRGMKEIFEGMRPARFMLLMSFVSRDLEKTERLLTQLLVRHRIHQHVITHVGDFSSFGVENRSDLVQIALGVCLDEKTGEVVDFCLDMLLTRAVLFSTSRGGVG